MLQAAHHRLDPDRSVLRRNRARRRAGGLHSNSHCRKQGDRGDDEDAPQAQVPHADLLTLNEPF